MFGHIFKYSMLSALRVKSLNFWILLFPIILGTLFSLAFGNFSNSEKFKSIPVVIVEEKQNENFNNVIKSISESDAPLLKPEYTDRKTAQEMLKKGECEGIITVTEQLSLTVSKNNIKPSILKNFLDQYKANEMVITDIAKNNPAALSAVTEQMSAEINCNKKLSFSNGNTDVMVQYYYNLIAMVCLFGSFLGMYAVINSQGNLSAIGARKCTSPITKRVSLSASLLSSFIVHVLCISLDLCYLMFILKINFGDNIPMIFAASFIGSAVSIAMGFFIGSIGKFTMGTKIGILSSFSMILCFFSGLMVESIRMKVERYFPVLNKISPAALISDSLYSINIYDTYDRFCTDIISLIIITIIFIAGGLFLTRRDEYASL